MPERSSGLRSFLSHPLAYRAFKALIGSQRRDLWLVGTQITAKAGDRVLDIGCGPGRILDYLPGVEYTGFDPNTAYIEDARRRYGGRGTFHHGAVSQPPKFDPGSYDIVLAKGVLHHLDDQEASAMLVLARRALRPGGRLVTFDGCFLDRQPALARFLLRMDRGMFVRTKDEYERLARSVFDDVESTVRQDLLRVPYTHLALQCTRID